MINSKKAMMDDLFDFLFLVIVMFFLMFYFNFTVLGGIDKKNEQSLVLAERNGKVDDYLVQNRMVLAQGKEIDTNELDSNLKYLYKSGSLPSPPPEILNK